MCRSTKYFVLWCVENKYSKHYTCNITKTKNTAKGLDNKSFCRVLFNKEEPIMRKRQRRRLVSLLICAMMAITLFAGCGASSKDTADTGSASSSKEYRSIHTNY